MKQFKGHGCKRMVGADELQTDVKETGASQTKVEIWSVV